MTPEQARAIVNTIGADALALMDKTEQQGEWTERDTAQLYELQARYVDYLDLLDSDPIPVRPCLDFENVAEYVMSFMEQK